MLAYVIEPIDLIVFRVIGNGLLFLFSMAVLLRPIIKWYWREITK
jgi:hypothetical protein